MVALGSCTRVHTQASWDATAVPSSTQTMARRASLTTMIIQWRVGHCSNAPALFLEAVANLTAFGLERAPDACAFTTLAQAHYAPSSLTVWAVASFEAWRVDRTLWRGCQVVVLCAYGASRLYSMQPERLL